MVWGCSGVPFFCVLVPFNSDNNCFVGADPRHLLLNCMKIKGVFSMIDFLNLFFDVFLFPIDPANLDFENNVIMIILSLCLIGIGFSRLLRRVLL